MAVYYRYRSGVDTFSVAMPSPSISVGELKRLIMATSRHGHGRTRGRGPRESVALYSDQTGEEYADDAALILRNSTVVVRRRAAGPPAETIVASSPPMPKATQEDGSSSSETSVRSSAPSMGDEEDQAISAVIDAAQLKWEDQGGYHVGRAPPAGYVCHRCRVPGHFIQHCPTNGDPRFDVRRHAAPTPVPCVELPMSSAIHDVPGAIPAELHCKICSKVMVDAVLTSTCCFDSFCDRCIRGHIVVKSRCACGAQARADDLVPNTTLRATIANMLAATTSASVGTGKPRSSVGSNAEEQKPASRTQSTAASQESRSHVTSEKAAASEHSGGSGSTSKKTATISGVLGPRKAQEIEGRGDHVDHHGHGAYGVAFCPAPYYDPYFGSMPQWGTDPYSMYYGGMPCGGDAAYGYCGEEQHRETKRARVSPGTAWW